MPNIVRTGGGSGGKVEINVSAELLKSVSRALPSLTYESSGGVAVAVVGTEAAYGGQWEYQSSYKYYRIVDVINVATNTGRSLTVLPIDAMGWSGGGVGDFAVFGGGYTDQDVGGTKTVAVNLKTNTTKALRDLSVARTDCTAAAASGKIIFAGGCVGGNKTATTYKSTLDIIDPASNTIKSSNNFAPARCFVASTCIGNEGIFGGGETGSSKFSSNVVAINPSTGTIRSLAGLSSERSKMAVAAIGDEAVFSGGKSTASNAVDAINAVTGTRRSLPALSLYRTGSPSAAAAGNEVLFVGGDYAEKRVEAVDVVAGATRMAGNLTVGRDGIASATVNKEAVFGGGRSCRVVEVFAPAPPNTFSIYPIRVADDLVLESSVSVDAACTYNGKDYATNAILDYSPTATTAVAKNVAAGQTTVNVRHVLKKGSYTI